MASLVTAKVEGMETVITALTALKTSIQRKLARRAMSKGARVLVAAVKAAVISAGAVQTRTLLLSIGFVVRTYRDNGKTVAIVGPRKGFKRAVVTGKRGRLRLATKKEIAAARASGQSLTYREPAFYGRLVEMGHRIATGGTLPRAKQIAGKSARTGQRGGGAHAGDVPPKPFMRPAWDRSRAEVLRTIRDDLAAGIKEQRK